MSFATLLFCQAIGLLSLVRWLGHLAGHDWYRSLSCLHLCVRGLVLWTTHMDASSTLGSIHLYATYTLVDTLYMTWNRNHRVELWVHHVLTLVAHYVAHVHVDVGDAGPGSCVSQLRAGAWLSMPCMLTLSHVSECLSVMNALCRHSWPSLLVRWRTFMLVAVRSPVWVLLCVHLNLRPDAGVFLGPVAGWFMRLMPVAMQCIDMVLALSVVKGNRGVTALVGRGARGVDPRRHTG